MWVADIAIAVSLYICYTVSILIPIVSGFQQASLLQLKANYDQPSIEADSESLYTRTNVTTQKKGCQRPHGTSLSSRGKQQVH